MSDSEEERLTALLALAMDVPEAPEGARPELDEIIQWADGKLAGSRAIEVAAFVARDAACYEIWREYAEARQKLEPKPGEIGQERWSLLPLLALVQGTLASWQTAVAGLALAAIVAVVVIQPFGPNPEEILDRQYQAWQSAGLKKPASWGWRVAISTRGAGLTPENTAFLSGISRGAQRLGEWSNPAMQVLSTLPSKPINCTDGDANCSARQDSLMMLGQWTVLNEVRCQADDPALSADLKSSLEFLSATADELRRRSCSSRYCAELSQALERPQSVKDLCELNTVLLEKSYP